MKNGLISLLLLLLPLIGFSQIKKEAVDKAKKGTLLVRMTGLNPIDSNFTKAIQNYWEFNENYRFKSKISPNSKSSIISLNLIKLVEVQKMNGLVTNSFELGDAYKLNLHTQKGQFGVGFHKNSELSYFDFVEAVKRFQFFTNEISEAGSWGKAWRGVQKKYSTELKDKTLLVDKSLLKEKLDEATFASIYPYEFAFVDSKVIEESVLQNDETKVYFSIVEEKVGILVQYICSSSNGKVYSHHYSAFQTKTARANKSFNQYIGVSDLKKLVKNFK